jgi:hypothetical protein
MPPPNKRLKQIKRISIPSYNSNAPSSSETQERMEVSSDESIDSEEESEQLEEIRQKIETVNELKWKKGAGDELRRPNWMGGGTSARTKRRN